VLSRRRERAILAAKPSGTCRDSETMAVETTGFVVPPGGGSVLSTAPNRSAVLKLLGGGRGAASCCSRRRHRSGPTTFHLHRDSDEVAWVQDHVQDWRGGHCRRAGHSRLSAAGRAACLEEHRHQNRPHPVSLHACRAGSSRNGCSNRPDRSMARRPTKCAAPTAGRSSAPRLSNCLPGIGPCDKGWLAHVVASPAEAGAHWADARALARSLSHCHCSKPPGSGMAGPDLRWDMKGIFAGTNGDLDCFTIEGRNLYG
jgi:hypothetical protein